jgi:predicted metalloprotease with PDZ domain
LKRANPPWIRQVFSRHVYHLVRGAVLLLGGLLPGLAPATADSRNPPISYAVDLREPATHLARITMSIPEAPAGTEIQFPAWNALYQIRDFVKNVEGLEARCDEQPIELARIDLYTWSNAGHSCSALEVRYSVYLNEDSVFSSVLNEEHAYLNPAMVLFYLPRERRRGALVRLAVPAHWKLATFLDGPSPDGVYSAANYDELADSPIEAGTFREYQYEQNGALYRIIVDAGSNQYDPGRIIESLQKITATATGLMQDVPFSRYTFLYHFGRETGGGMEHANGTAISFAANDLRNNWLGFESVSAHEFVHAWNVKRIRPQKLEPVDYIRGNDTSDLWFAEGLASTLQEYILLRAGLMSRDTFYARLGGEIRRLHDRPARHTQSLEDAGREAWLEKYPDYQRPERSISYYNKGMIVGFLLDLAIRQATGSRRSLDDVFRRLNTDFAKGGRYFRREDLVQILLEIAPSGCDFRGFFRDYITGTRELEYDKFLSYAGLRLAGRTSEEGALGFLAVRNFDGPVTVQSVAQGSSAARAGLEAGDELVEMNGKPLRSLPQDLLRGSKPGREVRFLIRRDGREFSIRFRLESAVRTAYHIEEMKTASPEQRLLRDHWLKGTTVSAAGAGKR